MSTPQTLSFGELFSGPGGLSLGLKSAGFAPTWAVDIDEWACATYNRNLGRHAICAKVEEVDFGDLPHVGGLAFGFPCNDFSQVGEQRGTGGYFGKLYQEAIRAVEEVSPDWFIAENVPGLLASDGHGIMELLAASGQGYRVSVHLYRFERYGVPQRRTRLIAVGIRQDLGLHFTPPAPTHRTPVPVKEAFEGVEEVAFNNERTRHTKRVIEMLSHIPEGENAWYEGLPERLRLNVNGCKISLIYRRLKRDEPSYTVTGSGGGGTHMYHYDEPRALTNRERARLQAFPDDFVFEGPKEAVRKQIGMAVPPLAAQRIGEALLATLRKRSYASIAPSLGLLEPGVAGPKQLEIAGL